MAYTIKLYDTEYDCIGSGCMSLDYMNFQLQMAAGDKVEVDISSGGGSHFEAVAMYHELKKYGVDTNNISIAASAASTVFAAGTKRTMSKYALLMIHPASIVTAGDAKILRSDADCLSKCTENVKQIWCDVTGQPYEVISPLVDNTTWLNAEMALELGFITDIEDYEIKEPVANASVILNKVIAAPSAYKQVINKILIKQEPEAATTENVMTKEEKDALIAKNESFFTKVKNWFKPSMVKVTTNKGDKFVLNTLAEGAPVFNDADMDTEAEDDDDIEATDADGKKVKMAVKDGKVSNVEIEIEGEEEEGSEDEGETKSEADEEGKEDEEDDADLEVENKVVLNSAGIKFGKKVDNKVIKNAMASKIAETSKTIATQAALIVDLKSQLAVSNAAIKQTEDEVKEKIKSDFTPEGSKRSAKAKVENAIPDFLKPAPGSLAANAMSKAKATR